MSGGCRAPTGDGEDQRAYPNQETFCQATAPLPMMPTDPASRPPASQGQPLIVGLLMASLVAMAVWYLMSGGPFGGLVHNDAPPPATATFSVDLNTAGERELAQLPGLGPTTAARIVEHRREQGPFASPDDLLAVPGIGPVTLEAILPHLRPLPPSGPPSSGESL